MPTVEELKEHLTRPLKLATRAPLSAPTIEELEGNTKYGELLRIVTKLLGLLTVVDQNFPLADVKI